jgi:hypothetical protein
VPARAEPNLRLRPVERGRAPKAVSTISCTTATVQKGQMAGQHEPLQAYPRRLAPPASGSVRVSRVRSGRYAQPGRSLACNASPRDV